MSEGVYNGGVGRVWGFLDNRVRFVGESVIVRRWSDLGV